MFDPQSTQVLVAIHHERLARKINLHPNSKNDPQTIARHDSLYPALQHAESPVRVFLRAIGECVRLSFGKHSLGRAP